MIKQKHNKSLIKQSGIQYISLGQVILKAFKLYDSLCPSHFSVDVVRLHYETFSYSHKEVLRKEVAIIHLFAQ